MAETRLRFDAVVKDLFQRDLPTLLAQLAGPAEVREFLNVEFSVVEERVADLVLLLSDGSILHLDFQSHNDPEMPYREGIYGLMIAKRYRRRRVRQVVTYMGAAKMRMKDTLDLGGIQVKYQLVDIREFDAGAMLASGNPGDFALRFWRMAGCARCGRFCARRMNCQSRRGGECSRRWRFCRACAGHRNKSQWR